MQYNKDSHINNVDDVRKFFHYIVEERNMSSKKWEISHFLVRINVKFNTF